jgi:hypothetical protein
MAAAAWEHQQGLTAAPTTQQQVVRATELLVAHQAGCWFTRLMRKMMVQATDCTNKNVNGAVMLTPLVNLDVTFGVGAYTLEL